jgi:hypothetical protein
MKGSALDRIADEALKRHLEARSAINTHAHRAALEALQDSFVLNRRNAEQLFEPISALRSRLDEISQKIINQGEVAQKALAATMLHINESALQQSRELLATAAFNSVVQFQHAHRDIFAGIRSALDRDLSPMLAAIQTMQGLGLANISPEFSEYVSETLDEVEESGQQAQIPKTPGEIFEAKSKGLSAYEQARLTLAIAILAMILQIFQTYQAGQPIKIDPVQLEQLKAHPEITINIYNLFSQINEPVEYEVMRDVALKLKPKNCSTTLGILKAVDKDKGKVRVKLIRMSHQWIYVEYHDEEEDLPINGWVNKKYLKRLR